MNRSEIREIAKRYGWVEEKEKDPNVMIFNRMVDGRHQQVNVWPGRMTVATVLKHPKLGKNQLYRYNVDAEQLEAIFKNPRVHTPNGYRTRDELPQVKDRVWKLRMKKQRSRS